MGLPAGSWWKLVVEGSMLEIVRTILGAAEGELVLGQGRQQLHSQPW